LCGGCAALTALPDLPEGLEKLWCFDCTSLTSLPDLPAGLLLQCRGCKWLSNGNPKYRENIQKLQILQRNFKTILFRRKLTIRSMLKNIFYRDLARLIETY
jgi:hypothetical protein